MKNKFLIAVFLLLSILSINSGDMKYIFVYIPGMFDNGDLLLENSQLVKNLNNKDGYYHNNYFNDQYNYNDHKITCSSNIVGAKYNRLSVANLVGLYRTDISLYLMADRLYCFIHGEAPDFKDYKRLTNYKGNDYNGIVSIGAKNIAYSGLVEEIWAKYGKKVYYGKVKNGYKIILKPGADEQNFYMNDKGYFNDPEEIKFNIVAHSCGGVALRQYIKICKDKNIDHHINSIINLSVPQKGARLVYALKGAFQELIKDSIDKVYSDKEKTVQVKDADGNIKNISYKTLIEDTKIGMMYGDKACARFLRKIVGNYILYYIPFDGHKNVLGFDPAIKDLHPDHRMIKSLNSESLPESVNVYNFRVIHPYAIMFNSLGYYLKLGKSDGAVDFDDTALTHLPGYDRINNFDVIVEKANHIPFPYIKPVYHLSETIDENYSFLKILLKKKVNKEQNEVLLEALFLAIMHEFGLKLDDLLKNENYSVIDYFADNPIEIK